MNFQIQADLTKYNHTKTEFNMTFEVSMNDKSDVVYVSKDEFGVKVEPENTEFNDIEMFVITMKVMELAIFHSNKGKLVG